MKKACFWIGMLWMAVPCLVMAQAVENGDFKGGKNRWMGDGVVVFLDSEDVILPGPKADATPALLITLKKGGWSTVEQRLKATKDGGALNLSFKVKALDDFKPADASREYEKGDFQVGSQYWMTGRIFPKCGLLLQLQDSKWYYRLFDLKPGGGWIPLQAAFNSLEAKSRLLAFALPPGEGRVLLKDIQ